MFPNYLLNKVYVQKSLKNIPAGYEFTLRNVVDSGTLSGVKALLVDGVEVPLSSVTLATSAGEHSAEAINGRASIPLRYNAEAVIRVAGQPLPAGKHDIKFAISVMEAGRIEIAFSDEAG